MSMIKRWLSTAARFGQRPGETWRLARQTVHELHVVLQGATQLVGELEARLDRLESDAAPRATKSRTSRSGTKLAPAHAGRRRSGGKARAAR